MFIQKKGTGKKKHWEVHYKKLLTLQEAWWVQHCHTNLDNHSNLPLQVFHSLSCLRTKTDLPEYQRNPGIQAEWTSLLSSLFTWDTQNTFLLFTYTVQGKKIPCNFCYSEVL